MTKLTKSAKSKVVRKKISWKIALNCAKAQCTMKEIAAILDVCENTLRERCLEENGVSLLKFFELARIAGLASLRRKLFKMANEKDNFPALKFALGNYLKMYEKNELVVAAKYVQYTDEERKMLRKLAMEKAQAELEQGRMKAIEEGTVSAIEYGESTIIHKTPAICMIEAVDHRNAINDLGSRDEPDE